MSQTVVLNRKDGIHFLIQKIKTEIDFQIETHGGTPDNQSTHLAAFQNMTHDLQSMVNAYQNVIIQIKDMKTLTEPVFSKITKNILDDLISSHKFDGSDEDNGMALKDGQNDAEFRKSMCAQIYSDDFKPYFVKAKEYQASKPSPGKKHD